MSRLATSGASAPLHLQSATGTIAGAPGGAATSVFDRQLREGSAGDRLWSTPLYTTSTPCVDATGDVYVGTIEGNVYKLDGSTGEKKKEFTAPAKIVGSEIVLGHHNEIYFCSQDGTLQALDRDTLEPLWHLKIEGEATSTPLVGRDGTVYFLAPDLRLYALDGQTGKEKWPSLDIAPGPEDRESLSSLMRYRSPALDPNGTVYVPAPKGGVLAVNGLTGAQEWASDDREHEPSGTPVPGRNGLLYVGGTTYDLRALDATTGAEKWRFTAAGFVRDDVTVGDDGTVYVGGDNKGIYAIDGTTGEQKWFKELEGRGVKTPLLDQGVLYVHMGAGSTPNHLYALDARDGTVRFEAGPFGPYGAALTAPAKGIHGEIYFGNKDGNVYAIQGYVPEPDLGKVAAEIVQGETRPAPTLEMADGFVIIGGVRVPIRR